MSSPNSTISVASSQPRTAQRARKSTTFNNENTNPLQTLPNGFTNGSSRGSSSINKEVVHPMYKPVRNMRKRITRRNNRIANAAILRSSSERQQQQQQEEERQQQNQEEGQQLQQQQQALNYPIPSTSRENYPIGIGRGKGGLRRMERVRNVVLRQSVRQERISLRYIRQTEYWTSRENSIPKAALKRVVRDCFDRLHKSDMKIQYGALEILLDSAESYLIDIFERCTLLCTHARRVTCMPKDLFLALRLLK